PPRPFPTRRSSDLPMFYTLGLPGMCTLTDLSKVIHSLSSGSAPAMGAEWWLEDAIVDPTAAECQRLGLKASELRAEVNQLVSSATRTQENISRVRDLMHRAQVLDQQAAAWMKSVPEAWQPRTLCWQLQSLSVPDGDYSK